MSQSELSITQVETLIKLAVEHKLQRLKFAELDIILSPELSSGPEKPATAEDLEKEAEKDLFWSSR